MSTKTIWRLQWLKCDFFVWVCELTLMRKINQSVFTSEKWAIWALNFPFFLLCVQVPISATRINAPVWTSFIWLFTLRTGIDFTHRLTVVSSWFRPAAGRLLAADSLTVSAPSAALPLAVPHPKQTAFIPSFTNTHLPPLESTRCSTEPVKGLVRFKKRTYFAISPHSYRHARLISTQAHQESGLLDELYFLTGLLSTNQHIR